jgi:hypothetical protein
VVSSFKIYFYASRIISIHVYSLGSEVVGRMLVHMIRPLKLADAHKDISKTVGGWFITLIHGLF